MVITSFVASLLTQPAGASGGSHILTSAVRTGLSQQILSTSAGSVTLLSSFPRESANGSALPASDTVASCHKLVEFHPCKVSVTLRSSAATCASGFTTSVPSTGYGSFSEPQRYVKLGEAAYQRASAAVDKPTSVFEGAKSQYLRNVREVTVPEAISSVPPSAHTFPYSQARGINSSSGIHQSFSSNSNTASRSQVGSLTSRVNRPPVLRTVKTSDSDGIFNIMQSIVPPVQQQRLRCAGSVHQDIQLQSRGSSNVTLIAESSANSRSYHLSDSIISNQTAASCQPFRSVTLEPYAGPALAGRKRPGLGTSIDNSMPAAVLMKKPRCTSSKSLQRVSSPTMINASLCNSVPATVSGSDQYKTRRILSGSETASSVHSAPERSLPLSSCVSSSNALLTVNMTKFAMLPDPAASATQHRSLNLPTKLRHPTPVRSQHVQLQAETYMPSTVSCGLDLSQRTMRQQAPSGLSVWEQMHSTDFSKSMNSSKHVLGATSKHEVHSLSAADHQPVVPFSRSVLLPQHLPISEKCVTSTVPVSSYDLNVENSVKSSVTTLGKFHPEIGLSSIKCDHTTSSNTLHSMANRPLASAPISANSFLHPASVTCKQKLACFLPDSSSTCKTLLNIDLPENLPKKLTGLTRFPNVSVFSQFAASGEMEAYEKGSSHSSLLPSTMNSSSFSHTPVDAFGNTSKSADVKHPKSIDSFSWAMLQESPPAKPLRVQPTSLSQLEQLSKFTSQSKMERLSADGRHKGKRTELSAAIQRQIFKSEEPIPSRLECQLTRPDQSFEEQNDMKSPQLTHAIKSEILHMAAPRKSSKSTGSKMKSARAKWQALVSCSFGADLSGNLLQSGNQLDSIKSEASSQNSKDIISKKRSLSSDKPVNRGSAKPRTDKPKPAKSKRQLSLELKLNHYLKNFVVGAEAEPNDPVVGVASENFISDHKV
jgi:hypothetical protein